MRSIRSEAPPTRGVGYRESVPKPTDEGAWDPPAVYPPR
jgi:hypothetical protein